MKKLLLVIAAVIAVTADCYAWSLHCENGSCDASYGRIKVFWVGGIGGESNDRITGVEGLPVSIEDFKNSEKRIEDVLCKTTSVQKEKTTILGISIPGMSVSSGSQDSQQMLFSKSQNMSTTSSQGEGVTYNKTTKFLKWVGVNYVTAYRINDVRRYLAAAEIILNKFDSGQLPEMVSLFCLQSKAGWLDKYPIDSPVTEENKSFIQAKYYGLTQLPGIKDPAKRYTMASLKLQSSSQDLNKLSATYNDDIKNLSILCKGGQTALGLYKDGRKDLALVKWTGDIKVKGYADPKDKYVIALQLNRDKELGSLNSEFEKAISSRDKSVTLVTFSGTSFPAIPWRLIFEVALVITILVLSVQVYRRKSQPQPVPEEVL